MSESEKKPSFYMKDAESGGRKLPSPSAKGKEQGEENKEGGGRTVSAPKDNNK